MAIEKIEISEAAKDVSMRIPDVEDLSEYYITLVPMVARTSWLPNRDTVKALQGAVFPTSRYKSGHGRFSHIEENGVIVGMYDDTPEWAMFWAHGLTGTRQRGWTIAHIWPASDDICSYTEVANLALVPEPFASLTDKDGPLAAFLRWHAWEAYGWKPKQQADPTKPNGFDDISWRYLRGEESPRALIRKQIYRRNNERTRILRPIMERRKML
jgi:hypothetical protein